MERSDSDHQEKYFAYVQAKMDARQRLTDAREKRANIYLWLVFVSPVIWGTGMVLGILGTKDIVNPTISTVAFFIGMTSIIGFCILFCLYARLSYKIDTESRPNLFERWFVK